MSLYHHYCLRESSLVGVEVPQSPQIVVLLLCFSTATKHAFSQHLISCAYICLFFLLITSTRQWTGGNLGFSILLTLTCKLQESMIDPLTRCFFVFCFFCINDLRALLNDTYHKLTEVRPKFKRSSAAKS